MKLQKEHFSIRNKTIATVALILILTATTFLSIVPTANAQTISPKAFLSVTPNPVGINQQTTIVIWVQPIPPDSSEVFSGFEVTITKPDGTTETLGPVNSWPVGAAFFTYTPTSLGTYKFKFNYPGETFASTGEEYLSAESPTADLIVQQEKIPDWPKANLPTDYWTQPVNTENREWSTISGSWLMCYYNSTYTGFADATAGFNPYSQAPRAPHIMWTKALTAGGLAGGDLGSLGQYSGLSYDVRLTPPIIMNGKLYYNLESSLWGHFRREKYGGFVCADLRTGQELWQSQEGGVDVGQQYFSSMPGGQGVFSFLWDVTGSTWDVYTAFDGKLQFSFDNATQGTDWWWEDPVVFGADGTMFVYILDGYANYLAMWNSTKAFWGNGIMYTGSEGLPRFRYSPGSYDWTKGIEWNVTIPDRQVGWHAPYSIFGISGDVAIAKSGTGGNEVDFDIAYDTNTGQEIWVHDKANSVQTFFSVTGEGVFASFDLTERRWTGYNIQTGGKLWESDQNQYPWGTYVSYAPIIAYGKLYSGSFDGYLHAFDITNGKEVWKFYSGDSGTETVFGTWPFWNGPIIADGIVFAGTGEETPTQPLTRGNRVFALDAQTGKELWSISGYMSLRAIADGYLLGYNGYDSQAYCFGKGPSAVTVDAPLTSTAKGQSVTIRGTVTDVCEGAKQLVKNGLFDVVPAMSDESMGSWMEYLYMQQPMPQDAKGVTVKLTAVNSNGNSQNIGTATTDANGNYAITWTPSAEGLYKITATFENTDSYYGSSQTTYLTIGSAEATQQSATSSTDIYVIAAAIAVIIAVIAAAIAILRKLK